MQLLIDLRYNLRTTAKGIAAKDDPTKKALFEQTDLIRKRKLSRRARWCRRAGLRA